jgi:hypothetical protein
MTRSDIATEKIHTTMNVAKPKRKETKLFMGSSPNQFFDLVMHVFPLKFQYPVIMVVIVVNLTLLIGGDEFLKKFVLGLALGCVLTAATSAFADPIKEYILTKIDYPIFVNGTEFKSEDLPALNYEGNTYLPLRAIGDVLGEPVKWNDQLKRVEIGTENSTAVQTQQQYKYNYNKYVQVVQINGKRYMFSYAPFIVSDKDNHYFVRFDIEVMNLLVSIGNNDYNTGTTQNPYVDGYIEAKNLSNNNVYVEEKNIYTSIKDSYRNFTYFNHDKSKKYEVVFNPGNEKGVIHLSPGNSYEWYVPMKDFFDQVGLHVNLELDEKNSMMVWTFS